MLNLNRNNNYESVMIELRGLSPRRYIYLIQCNKNFTRELLTNQYSVQEILTSKPVILYNHANTNYIFPSASCEDIEESEDEDEDENNSVSVSNDPEHYYYYSSFSDTSAEDDDEYEYQEDDDSQITEN